MTTTTPTRLPVRDELGNVPAYGAPMSIDDAAAQLQRADILALSSNENLHGPSPAVTAAITGALAGLQFYPDPGAAALRRRLSDDLGLAPERLVFGPGSEALIDYALRIVLRPGDVLVQSPPTFPPYAAITRGAGATVRDVPRTPAMDLDTGALLAALADAPRVLVICTPNNPTGNLVSRAQLQELLAGTGHDTLVILDEAYLEYVPAGDRFDAVAMLDAWGGPFLVLRTFSKAFGLASLRVGYGIASTGLLVEYLNRVRPLFNLSRLAQVAALAAWTDRAHLDAVVADTTTERARVTAALRAMGIEATASAANFVFFPVADAPALGDALLREGIMVRAIAIPGRHHLRVTIGRPADNDRFLSALAKTLQTET